MREKRHNILFNLLFFQLSFFLILFSYSCDLPVEVAMPVPEPDLPDDHREETPDYWWETFCNTQEAVLKNGKGIRFFPGKIVQKDDSDIYFENDKFYSGKERGKIATVGDQGYMSLCDINYPEEGYSDSCKIVRRYVYMYYHIDIRAEIRVIFFRESEEVKFIFHVRID